MRLLVASILLAASQSSFAFSNFVHQLICSTAYELTAPETKAFIDDLIEHSNVGEGKSFSEACIWPDAVRKTTHQETYEYHFINTPHDLSFDHDRDCAAYDCVTQAIQRYALNLSAPTVKTRDKKEALLFLGHFVGDIHQPLNIGNAEDYGGNTITIFTSETDDTANTKLRSVWDSNIPYKVGLGRSSSQQELLDKIAGQDRSEWQNFDFVSWAQESFTIARENAYAFPDGSPVVNDSRLNKAYYNTAEPIIYEQVMKASVRLAFLLDQAVLGHLIYELSKNKEMHNALVLDTQKLQQQVKNLKEVVSNMQEQVNHLEEKIDNNSFTAFSKQWETPDEIDD